MNKPVDLRSTDELHMEFADNLENLIEIYKRLLKQQECIL